MKMIVLDRDGVINEEAKDPEVRIKSPQEWIAIPGSLEAINKLCQNGYTVTVATNQSGIGRGIFDRATLEAIHQKMLSKVKDSGGRIDHIYFCPHSPEEHCECRKPKPGLLHQIAQDYPIKISEIYFIGDALSDYQASIAAGCQFGLVLTGKGKQTQEVLMTENIPTFKNLLDVAEKLKG
ncbi:MAG: D-glycero-beta-D-manno-heptose 1,7-bisphosphate 7-phosphatase [Gammaproteobacteria bacterium]|nr:D-glycero-beta-D-manno-heptose 1,7-bisphosphate 7-phosphatase [Gammaproteobacteria bacterium]